MRQGERQQEKDNFPPKPWKCERRSECGAKRSKNRLADAEVVRRKTGMKRKRATSFCQYPKFRGLRPPSKRQMEKKREANPSSKKERNVTTDFLASLPGKLHETAFKQKIFFRRNPCATLTIIIWAYICESSANDLQII